MADLFATSGELDVIRMHDADVRYARHIDLPGPCEELLRRLIADIPWRAESIVVWGKTHLQPRLLAWYGDPGASYVYSGIRHEPLPWTSDLLAIKARVEAAAGEPFNSVLANYYRDERDSMGLHSDDEPELGERPVIASLSLGAERTLTFKHKTRAATPSVRITLGSGSLLVMRGDTQRFWKHGVGKQSRACGPRVNLTYRLVRPRLRPARSGRRSNRV